MESDSVGGVGSSSAGTETSSATETPSSVDSSSIGAADVAEMASDLHSKTAGDPVSAAAEYEATLADIKSKSPVAAGNYQREVEAAFGVNPTHAAKDAAEKEQKVADLQQRVEDAGGLTREILNEIYADESINLADVLEPGIYSIEFDVEVGNVNTVGEHRHFVRVDENGKDQIITGFPDGDILRAEIGDYRTSIHNPVNQQGDDDVHRVDQLEGITNPDATWGEMVEAAEDINEADLNYNFLAQNSNSINSTVAEQAGITIDMSGYAPGEHNTLVDEMEGGDQADILTPGGSGGGSSGSGGSSDGSSGASGSRHTGSGSVGSNDRP